MIELPKCPYCGEMMRFDADSVHVWMKCENCLSCGPKVCSQDYKNSVFPFASWSEFWYKCRELAIEAALRRDPCIQQLEEQIEFMKMQMQGDCGVCKYTEVRGGLEPCASCMLDASRPSWEYGGLPEVKEND